jgi:sigma-B regulation protein RsbU (phosphoserine phosphatase)
VADVSGKGVGAGLLSGMARTALRLALARGDDPAEALSAAGRLLYRDLERTGRFLTGCVISLDPEAGLVTYADAGHGHHLLLTPDGEAHPLPGGGLPLGFLPQPELAPATLTMIPRARLALFSDGLVEGDGEPSARAVQLAAEITAGRAARDIVAEAPDDDDRTLVVLERLA